ncbi:MAG: sensor histidine kinase [Bacillota bacterium]
MSKLLSFLRYRLTLLLFYVIAVVTVLGVSYLADQDGLIARYIVLLLSFFLAVILLVDGIRFLRRKRALEELSCELFNATRPLPAPNNALEADYIQMIHALGSAYDALNRQLFAAHSETLEYYTLWVHQIKTPIAALRLVLSKMEGEEAGVIRQELFKIEQYADLALRYVKLSDIASDLVLEACSLSDVVHESVKKFGILFVYQKLSIEISPLEKTVTSDKKWLGFILEQILSNALKYTPSGGIRVYLDGAALCIKDSGIGIRAEDLPRIFAKGYTGYNGRIDSRASGVGLYLAKKAADALSVSIRVESKVGAGTKVSLVFPDSRTDLFR